MKRALLRGLPPRSHSDPQCAEDERRDPLLVEMPRETLPSRVLAETPRETLKILNHDTADERPGARREPRGGFDLAAAGLLEEPDAVVRGDVDIVLADRPRCIYIYIYICIYIYI